MDEVIKELGIIVFGLVCAGFIILGMIIYSTIIARILLQLTDKEEEHEN